jgi:ABC-2 type transport system ATP-binding protein
VQSVISVRHVSKRFRRTAVLDDLCLEAPEGSVYGLVGPNGVGKTTTIKILMNILRADSGESEVLGTDSRRLGPGDFARIGYVSENQSMPAWMSVKEWMAYLKPFYPTWDDALAAELLRDFDLPPQRKLRQLSRGMWMKTALASSLAYRPRLLVLDEPFSGLDPLVRDDIVRGVLGSAEETTILVSSHDLAEMESFASHIAYLDRGRLQFCEELTSLQARFREVEVTVEPGGASPADGAWPAHWLRPEQASAVIRFIDSQYDAGRSESEIRARIEGVRSVAARAMPLRAIFVTLARAGAEMRTL